MSNDCFIVKKLVIGTESWELPASKAETHGWRFYIKEELQSARYENNSFDQHIDKTPDENDHDKSQKILSKGQISLKEQNIPLWIDRVDLFLHETFTNPHRPLLAPYELEERGWGEFVILIHLFIREKRFEFHHKLILFHDQLKEEQIIEQSRKKSLKRYKKKSNEKNEELPGGARRRSTQDKTRHKTPDTIPQDENTEQIELSKNVEKDTNPENTPDLKKETRPYRRRSHRSNKKTEIIKDNDHGLHHDKKQLNLNTSVAEKDTVSHEEKTDIGPKESSEGDTEKEKDIDIGGIRNGETNEKEDPNPNGLEGDELKVKQESEPDTKKDLKSDETNIQKKHRKRSLKKESQSDDKTPKASMRRNNEQSDQKISIKSGTSIIKTIYRDDKKLLVSERVETFVFHLPELQTHAHRRKLNQKDLALFENILPGIEEESDSETERIDKAIKWVVKEIEKEQ